MFLVLAGALFGATTVYAQDSPSLGDIARQSRLQKQQKDAQAKDASPQNGSAAQTSNKDAQGQDAATDGTTKATPASKTTHVITNDEIPEHVGPTAAAAPASQAEDEPEATANSGNRDARADQWKNQIQSTKSSIASMEREIASLNESIHYAGGNCVAHCEQWNERQKEKQDRVETMKAQLEEQKKRLEDMQEAARKQGFGSSVYDP
jgi:chromosome segregation ATPase